MTKIRANVYRASTMCQVPGHGSHTAFNLILINITPIKNETSALV